MAFPEMLVSPVIDLVDVPQTPLPLIDVEVSPSCLVKSVSPVMVTEAIAEPTICSADAAELVLEYTAALPEAPGPLFFQHLSQKKKAQLGLQPLSQAQRQLQPLPSPEPAQASEPTICSAKATELVLESTAATPYISESSTVLPEQHIFPLCPCMNTVAVPEQQISSVMDKNARPEAPILSVMATKDIPDPPTLPIMSTEATLECLAPFGVAQMIIPEPLILPVPNTEAIPDLSALLVKAIECCAESVYGICSVISEDDKARSDIMSSPAKKLKMDVSKDESCITEEDSFQPGLVLSPVKLTRIKRRVSNDGGKFDVQCGKSTELLVVTDIGFTFRESPQKTVSEVKAMAA
ncbi:unnamed protein product [Leuciscus chuanchicus]